MREDQMAKCLTQSESAVRSMRMSMETLGENIQADTYTEDEQDFFSCN